MIWMQRLKRVFGIDIEVCERCRGHVKVVASIEVPAVVEYILEQLRQKAANADTPRHAMPSERALPQARLFDPSQTRPFD